MKTLSKATPAELLETARQQAEKSTSWMDFANFLFNQETGLISVPFSSAAERKRFMKTKEYKAIYDLLEEVQNRTGFDTNLKPWNNGRFIVRLPSSLHHALIMEAVREGVSLDQLVVAKLAVPLVESVTKNAG